MKNLLTQWETEEENRQIAVDEKPPNPRGTEEENRSAEVETGYDVFAFLFRVLVAGQPRFHLAALVGLLRRRAIVGPAIGGAVSTGGEVAVGLSGLSLWKALNSFRRCCTADAGSQVFFSSE